MSFFFFFGAQQKTQRKVDQPKNFGPPQKEILPHSEQCSSCGTMMQSQTQKHNLERNPNPKSDLKPKSDSKNPISSSWSKKCVTVIVRIQLK